MWPPPCPTPTPPELGPITRTRPLLLPASEPSWAPPPQAPPRGSSSSEPLLSRSSADLGAGAGRGGRGSGHGGAPGGGPMEGQTGGPGAPAALASAMTLRLRFRSSEGPPGGRAFCSLALGPRLGDWAAPPATHPPLAGTRRWRLTLPHGLLGGSLEAGSLATQRRSLTHALHHWVPGGV